MKPTRPYVPIIMVAPTGARREKADHPALPMTTSEIVAEVIACHAAGADALHLHIRDKNGRHSLDAGLYRETLQALYEALPQFPVQITTEAAGVFSVADQLNCLREVRPIAASVAVRETARTPELADHVYGLCAEAGTKLQHIIFDRGDWDQLASWKQDGVIRPGQDDLLFVLGRYEPPRDARPSDLDLIANWMLDGPGSRMVCAFGANERQVLNAAARLGADLRVGFENNIFNPDGTRAESNAANVAALRADLDNILEKGLVRQ